MLNVNGARLLHLQRARWSRKWEIRGVAEDAPGDGKQQFTVEKSTLVDSFCGVEVTVLSLYQSFGTMKHEKTA